MSSYPNRGGSEEVEQFQRSCRNWFWHSATASCAPSCKLGSRKGFLMHSSLWWSLKESPLQPGSSGTPAEVTASHLRTAAAAMSVEPATTVRVKPATAVNFEPATTISVEPTLLYIIF